jgi:hypothetical protein
MFPLINGRQWQQVSRGCANSPPKLLVIGVVHVEHEIRVALKVVRYVDGALIIKLIVLIAFEIIEAIVREFHIGVHMIAIVCGPQVWLTRGDGLNVNDLGCNLLLALLSLIVLDDDRDFVVVVLDVLGDVVKVVAALPEVCREGIRRYLA